MKRNSVRDNFRHTVAALSVAPKKSQKGRQRTDKVCAIQSAAKTEFEDSMAENNQNQSVKVDSQQGPARVNEHVLTLLLAACSMIGPFATDMYLPSFHDMMGNFCVGLEAVQQTLSAYLIGFAVMTLFYGTISDVIGRKPTMVLGFAFFALASLGAALSSSLEALIAYRAFEGVFAGCGMVVGMAVIRDLYGGPQAQKLMAYVAMVFGFGPAMAPIIGGYLAVHAGWQSHFWVLAVISFALAAMCLFFLPESLPKQKRTPVSLKVLVAGYVQCSLHLPFMLGSLALGLAFLGQGCFIAGAADWCVNVAGLGADEFWKLFIPMVGGTVVGSWISTRLAVRVGTQQSIRAGFAVMTIAAAASLILIVLNHPVRMPWAVLPLSIYTIGIGIIRPGMSLVLMDCFPHSRGMASSVLSFVQTLLFAVCSAVIVPILYGAAWKYEVAIISFAAATIVLWIAAEALKFKLGEKRWKK